MILAGCFRLDDLKAGSCCPKRSDQVLARIAGELWIWFNLWTLSNAFLAVSFCMDGRPATCSTIGDHAHVCTSHVGCDLAVVSVAPSSFSAARVCSWMWRIPTPECLGERCTSTKEPLVLCMSRGRTSVDHCGQSLFRPGGHLARCGRPNDGLGADTPWSFEREFRHVFSLYHQL